MLIKMQAVLSLVVCIGLAAAQAQASKYQLYSIDQPIDHFPGSTRYAPHTNKTFKQYYVFDDTYYKPGGPVFVQLAGEAGAQLEVSVLQTGAMQLLMKTFNGLGVIFENRYYGSSYPFNTSTTDELIYLTTEQTIADNRYFAQHVTFPSLNTGNKSINAPGTPWFVYGVSLSGGQAAFTLKAHGDVIYGGFASSGLSNATLTYPAWYNPIQLLAPQDCVSSINGIVDKFDKLVAAKNTGAIKKFQEIFGLAAIKDVRDFAATIAFPLGGPLFYPTNTWQELNWDPKVGSRDFFYFCRNVTNINTPANNTAADYVLANYTNGEPWTNLGNYAAYVKRVVLPICTTGDYDSSNNGCFSTQNQSYWANVTNSYPRTYLYTTCTELGAYQAAAPSGPSLISRVIQADYTQQWCNWAFPAGKYNRISTNGPNVTWYNRYGGDNFTADRLAFVDGSADVWRDYGYHSEYAPRRYEQDPLHPELLINGGGHHWESNGLLDHDAEPQFIREAHDWQVRVVARWLRDFPSWKPGKPTGF